MRRTQPPRSASSRSNSPAVLNSSGMSLKSAANPSRFPALANQDENLSIAIENGGSGGLLIGVCSEQGKRPYQEDEFTIRTFLGNNKNPSSNSQGVPVETHLFGLFDGHAGGKCSKFVSTNLPDMLTEDSNYHGNIPQALKRTFHTANEQFLKIAEKLKLHDGSTGIVSLIRDNKLVVSNVGDCRALIITAGRPVQMSIDQKPTSIEEQKRINQLGGTVVNCMGVARVNGVLAVSRAFGNRTLRTVIRPDAEIMQRDLTKDDDFLVMASDGLWDVLRNKDVNDICYASSSLGCQQIAEELVHSALIKGSMDNVTCIVVRLSGYISRIINRTNEIQAKKDSLHGGTDTHGHGHNHNESILVSNSDMNSGNGNSNRLFTNSNKTINSNAAPKLLPPNLSSNSSDSDGGPNASWFGNGSMLLHRPQSGSGAHNQQSQQYTSAGGGAAGNTNADDDNISYLGAPREAAPHSAARLGSAGGSKMFSLNYPQRAGSKGNSSNVNTGSNGNSSAGNGNGFFNGNGSSLMMNMMAGTLGTSGGNANPNGNGGSNAGPGFSIPASPIQTVSKRPSSMGGAQRAQHALRNSNGMPAIAPPNRSFLSASFSEGNAASSVNQVGGGAASSSVAGNLSRSLQSPISLFMEKNNVGAANAMLAGYAGLRKK